MLLVYVQPKLFLFLSRCGTECISWGCSGSSILKPCFLLPIKAWKNLFSWSYMCFPLSQRQCLTKVWIKLMHLLVLWNLWNLSETNLSEMISCVTENLFILFIPFLLFIQLKGRQWELFYLSTETESNPIPSTEKLRVTHSYEPGQPVVAIKLCFNSRRVEATEHLFSTHTVTSIDWA